MNEDIKQVIFEKIKANERIIIMRHQRPDGDALGSSLGLAGLLRATWPEKDIRVLADDYSKRWAFIGKEDEPVAEDFYKDALGIVVDTSIESRISNANYKLCRELIKIDHHIDDAPYGDVSWVEDYRSSACEMIAELARYFSDTLVLNTETAKTIYTGMVTDSLRFQIKDTRPETLRLAAYLLETGFDTEAMFAHISIEDPIELVYRKWMYNNMKISPNGVAYFFIDQATINELGLDMETASNGNSYLQKLEGSLIWLAFLEYPDGNIRVRLRSRFLEIVEIAQRHHGGGHAQAAGATVYSWEEAEEVVSEADALLGDYKATHEGWL